MKPSFLIYAIGAAIVLLFALLLGWLVFLRPTPAAPSGAGAPSGLGSGTTKSVGTSEPANTNEVQPLTGTQASKQKVFKIADGPVTGAAFIQTYYPTTTLARYVLQENGHVLDYPLDTPGALPKAVSNTTIPGTGRAAWSRQGNTLLLQYIDSGTVKTVSLIFSAATSSRSATRPAQIQFLPDNITDMDFSPDGTKVAYLIPAKKGSDAYIASTDGSESKKLFSLPLSQMLLSWPSQNTLLLQTKSASNIPGIVFSADAGSGGVVQLLYASGLTAIADSSFGRIVYQASSPGEGTRRSYVHTIKTGIDNGLAFNPIPEKCVWGSVATNIMYCALPLKFLRDNYLDLWHMGAASQADTIESYTLGSLNRSHDIAIPGSTDGGVASDITGLSISPDDKYLLFIKKGDRSLWGVRLAQ